MLPDALPDVGLEFPPVGAEPHGIANCTVRRRLVHDVTPNDEDRRAASRRHDGHFTNVSFFLSENEGVSSRQK
jgi:hypothetical protein